MIDDFVKKLLCDKVNICKDKNRHRNKLNLMRNTEIMVILTLSHSSDFYYFKHCRKGYVCKYLKYFS